MSDPTYRLLLELAGRVDDDLLAAGRELVAVGEEGHALELLVAELVAGRTVLPPAVRAALVTETAARRIQPDADRGLPPAGSADDALPHRFAGDGPAAQAPALATALAGAGAPGGGWSLAWRVTPAGAAPGPLPQPVLLGRAGGDESAEVLTYQAQSALSGAGLVASVEVHDDGDPDTTYHRAAWAVARPLPAGPVASDDRQADDGGSPVPALADTDTDTDTDTTVGQGVAGSPDPRHPATGSDEQPTTDSRSAVTGPAGTHHPAPAAAVVHPPTDRPDEGQHAAGPPGPPEPETERPTERLPVDRSAAPDASDLVADQDPAGRPDVGIAADRPANEEPTGPATAGAPDAPEDGADPTAAQGPAGGRTGPDIAEGHTEPDPTTTVLPRRDPTDRTAPRELPFRERTVRPGRSTSRARYANVTSLPGIVDRDAGTPPRRLQDTAADAADPGAAGPDAGPAAPDPADGHGSGPVAEPSPTATDAIPTDVEPPAFGSPDFGSPGAGSPGSGWPGSGWPDSGSPDSGSPDTVWPGSGPPALDTRGPDRPPAEVTPLHTGSYPPPAPMLNGVADPAEPLDPAGPDVAPRAAWGGVGDEPGFAAPDLFDTPPARPDTGARPGPDAYAPGPGRPQPAPGAARPFARGRADALPPAVPSAAGTGPIPAVPPPPPPAGASPAAPSPTAPSPGAASSAAPSSTAPSPGAPTSTAASPAAPFPAASFPAAPFPAAPFPAAPTPPPTGPDGLRAGDPPADIGTGPAPGAGPFDTVVPGPDGHRPAPGHPHAPAGADDDLTDAGHPAPRPSPPIRALRRETGDWFDADDHPGDGHPGDNHPGDEHPRGDGSTGEAPGANPEPSPGDGAGPGAPPPEGDHGYARMRTEPGTAGPPSLGQPGVPAAAEDAWQQDWTSGAWVGDVTPVADPVPGAGPFPTADGAEIDAPTPPPGVPIAYAPPVPTSALPPGGPQGPRHLLLTEGSDDTGLGDAGYSDGAYDSRAYGAPGNGEPGHSEPGHSEPGHDDTGVGAPGYADEGHGGGSSGGENPGAGSSGAGSSGVDESSGDAPPADAAGDVPEIPRPTGGLADRLSPTEHDLLQRLHEELAARETGGEPTPRNGTARPERN